MPLQMNSNDSAPLSVDFSTAMMPSHRNVVSIAGMPGVGKTTLISNLIEIGAMHPGQLYARSFLTPEDAEKFVTLDELQKSVGRESLEPQYQRIYLNAELRRSRTVIDATSNDDFIVFDRGVEDTIYATELAADRSREEYHQLRCEFYPELLKIRSSHVILLNASLDTLRQRLIQRAAKTNRSPNREDYFELFYSNYVCWYQRNVTNCIVIETDQLSPSEVAEYAASTIRRIHSSTSRY